MAYTFAEQENDDLDVALFTKRLDTLLASASDVEEEVERLPGALQLLSTDERLSERFRNKLKSALEYMNTASVANIGPEITKAKASLALLAERASWADPADRKARHQAVADREATETYIAELEKSRKRKDRFPTRSTLEDFTQALAETGLVPAIYLLALQNGFNTKATLRKILQSLLSLWGFERQLG